MIQTTALRFCLLKVSKLLVPMSLAFCLSACTSSSSDEQLLKDIDKVPDGQDPNLSDSETEEYEQDGFEFDEGLMDEPGEDENEYSNEENAAELNPESVVLDLPESTESIDITRFMRERSTLTAAYEPLKDQFQEIFVLFEAGVRMPEGSRQELAKTLSTDRARTHWVFVEGVRQFAQALGRVSATGLRERKKKLIVHHMKTLSFIAKVLDKLSGGQENTAFTRKLYKQTVQRHLYRDVRKRK